MSSFRNKLIFIAILFVASCSQFTLNSSELRSRTIARTDVLNCEEAIAFIIDANVDNSKVRAYRFISARESLNLPVHIDVGGEGRYADALNVNPSKFTSTTGEPGHLIPNWIYGRSDDLPLPDGSVHRLTVESAPINKQAIGEILRVMRPRGQIDLYHPTDYAETVHKEILQELRRARKAIDIHQEKDDIGTRTTILLFR